MMPAPAASAVVLEMHRVSKTYSALRPLRLASLTMAAADRVSLGGMDAGGGELLVNLVTGASLPDAGEIRIFGRLTSDIATGDDWLDWLERFGIVSPRAVLLEEATLEQNLAIPFTLAIDPMPAEVAGRVRELAIECGIDAARWLQTIAAELPAEIRVLAHLARALALDPQFVIIEHPTADVAPATRQVLATAIARACAGRRLTTLVLTNDDAFGKKVAPRNLRLEGATGELRVLKRGWFG
jgi:ABC-type transporter Mla maintaining outer membrane lipid asymmetry ATPase subunit MlaF